MRNILVAVGLAALVLGTTACTRIRNNTGYIADEELTKAIAVGIDNRQSVMGTLGRPSVAGQFDDRTWYYISRNTEQLGFFTPKAKTQQVLAVTFDDKGNVSEVKRTGLETVADISPIRDKTPTLGRDTSLFEDLFGDIGAVGSAPVKGGDASNPN
jgi:outer membrane protein assembly factor BamE (lipoprotein component of BamABCDE complex)